MKLHLELEQKSKFVKTPIVDNIKTNEFKSLDNNFKIFHNDKLILTHQSSDEKPDNFDLNNPISELSNTDEYEAWDYLVDHEINQINFIDDYDTYVTITLHDPRYKSLLNELNGEEMYIYLIKNSQPNLSNSPSNFDDISIRTNSREVDYDIPFNESEYLL